MEARSNQFNFNDFRENLFQIVEAKISGVSPGEWKIEDTLRCLHLFVEGSGQVSSEVLFEASCDRDALARMLQENLIQFRLDTRNYELHSQLEKSYLLQKMQLV